MPGVWRKYQWRFVVLVVGSVAWLFCSPVLADIDYDTLKKGVVKITTNKETGAGIVVGVDSGVALIVTALHVVADVQAIQVVFPDKPYLQFSGRRFERHDDALDLAVVIVDPPSGKTIPQGLPQFLLGSVEALQLGAAVSAIGHPGGIDWQVAAMANTIQRLNDPDDSRLFRFTNISIERGNSGGPVFDSRGQLVGIVKKITPPGHTVAVKITEVAKRCEEWGIGTNLLVGDNDPQTIVTKPTKQNTGQANSAASASATSSIIAKPTKKPASHMVLVPAGDFFMGCNEKVDTECDDDENPRQPVNLPAFSLDKTEVAVADYQKCVDAGQCTQAHPGYECNWGVSGRENHPINCVDLSQAKAFCEWVGKRLPTNAEWEKAARGTDGRKYPWGNKDYSEVGKVANIADEAARKQDLRMSWALGGYDDGHHMTAPVGSFPAGASPFGALDIVGNVSEWTADWYDKGGKYSSVRGGSWNDHPQEARASSRYGIGPDRHGALGVRCAQ